MKSKNKKSNKKLKLEKLKVTKLNNPEMTKGGLGGSFATSCVIIDLPPTFKGNSCFMC